MTLWLTPDDAANELLARDPLALLLGMLLDQQITMEKAFRGPWDLRDRTGRELDAADLASRADLGELFARVPAIHRFPGSMSGRVQALCQALVDDYDGRADAVWDGVPTGAEVLRRLKALPGFGDQKARIFVALLGKQYGVRPTGWREAAGSYGDDGSTRSIADVVDPDSLLKVRAFKQEAKKAAKADLSGPGS